MLVGAVELSQEYVFISEVSLVMVVFPVDLVRVFLGVLGWLSPVHSAYVYWLAGFPLLNLSHYVIIQHEIIL